MYLMGVLFCVFFLMFVFVGVQDWNYCVWFGDILWDLGGFYLKFLVCWQQLQQYNCIDNFYQLLLGQLLCFLISWLCIELVLVWVLFVCGKVVLLGVDGMVICVFQVGEQLYIGDIVEIEGDFSIILEFVDVLCLQLCEYLCLCLDQLSCYGYIGMVDI